MSSTTTPTVDYLVLPSDLAVFPFKCLFVQTLYEKEHRSCFHQIFECNNPASEGPPMVEEARWKTRQPKDSDELKKWRKAWFASLREGNPVASRPEGNPLAGLPEGNPLASSPVENLLAGVPERNSLAGLPEGNPLAGNPPIESICEKFSEFLTNTLGTKRICRRTKRWWTSEVNEAHALMGKARASLRNRQISAQQFKGAQKTWFRTIRKAKRTSWATFLQEGKEEDIWKAISGKLAPMPMNALRKPDGGMATSPAEKAMLLAATSFPEDQNILPIPPIPPDPSLLFYGHQWMSQNFSEAETREVHPGRTASLTGSYGCGSSLICRGLRSWSTGW
jgi:hypothetical protein